MQLRVLLSVALALWPSLPAVASPQAPAAGLTVTVVKGEAGRNSIKTRSGIPIELEVRDDKNQLVAGAQVIFRLPSVGPSGSFPGGQLTSRVVTGPDGHAIMSGFVPNDLEGRFNIRITADSGALHGEAVVSQTNVAELASEKPKSRKALWILIAAGAGGAAAAAALAGGKSGSSPAAAPPAPSVTVTVGTISVGGPR